MAVAPRLLVLALATFVAGAAGSQEVTAPRSSYIKFTNLRILLSPDTSGIYLWASSGEPNGPEKSYSAVFDPAKVTAWVSDARWFLDQKTPNDANGSSLTSAALSGLEDAGRVYLVRRRNGSDWSRERFLIFEPKNPGIEPLIVSGYEPLIREILDSVEVVSRGAPPFKPAILRDSSGAEIEFDEPARLKPGQKPPAYPGNYRMNGREGIVIVRFVVGIDGKADMSSARTVASSGASFEKSVLSTLPKLRFEPAKLHGAPVRQLVVMPFDFALYRR